MNSINCENLNVVCGMKLTDECEECRVRYRGVDSRILGSKNEISRILGIKYEKSRKFLNSRNLGTKKGNSRILGSKNGDSWNLGNLYPPHPNKQRHKNDIVDLLCVRRENQQKNIGPITGGDREKIHDLFCKIKC